MKKYIITLLLILLPAVSFADDFLGAPILPDSLKVKEEAARLEYTTGKYHDEVLAFYKEELKSFEDIKYRDWDEATYIEDDGRMPWHSITISKEMNSEGTTTVVIAKDSWTWIMGTLILRYIAVFIVLLVLFAGMKISGGIISMMFKKA